MRDWRYLEGVSENPGAIVRRTWISKEKVEWYGELGMDFLDTPAYLLPNTPLTIRLTRSPPEFYMIQEDSEKAFRFVITDIHLDVKSVKVADALNEEIEQVLTTMPARILMKVDLPAPFGPKRPKIEPRGTSKSMPFKACLAGALPAA